MSAARRATRSHDPLDAVDAVLVEAGECPVCAQASWLVTPDCAEGHGDACPDRLCVDCGTALFVGPMLLGSLAQSA